MLKQELASILNDPLFCFLNLSAVVLLILSKLLESCLILINGFEKSWTSE